MNRRGQGLCFSHRSNCYRLNVAVEQSVFARFLLQHEKYSPFDWSDRPEACVPSMGACGLHRAPAEIARYGLTAMAFTSWNCNAPFNTLPYKVLLLTFMCFRKELGCVYDLSQPRILQLYGLSEVWTCECFFLSDELANLRSQPSYSHLKGFSPET